MSWQAPLAYPELRLEKRVQPAHTALVLIDLQNDFCHPDGFMGQMGEAL